MLSLPHLNALAVLLPQNGSGHCHVSLATAPTLQMCKCFKFLAPQGMHLFDSPRLHQILKNRARPQMSGKKEDKYHCMFYSSGCLCGVAGMAMVR